MSWRGELCSAGLHGGGRRGSRKNGPCELWTGLRAGGARQPGWPKAHAGPPQILAPGTSQLCSWGPLPPLHFPIPGPPQRVSSPSWASWLQITWGVAAAPPVCLSAIAWANWASCLWGSGCVRGAGQAVSQHPPREQKLIPSQITLFFCDAPGTWRALGRLGGQGRHGPCPQRANRLAGRERCPEVRDERSR